MISSCPNYLYADVSDDEDLSHHQQEVTGGQLVAVCLVSSIVDSDVALKCYICCQKESGATEHSPLPTGSPP